MNGFKINSYSWGHEKGWLRDLEWDTRGFVSLIAAESHLNQIHLACLRRAMFKNSLYHNVSDIQVGGDGLNYFTYEYDHDPRLVRIVPLSKNSEQSPMDVLKKIKEAFDSNLIGPMDRKDIRKMRDAFNLQILVEDVIKADSGI